MPERLLSFLLPREGLPWATQEAAGWSGGGSTAQLRRGDLGQEDPLEKEVAIHSSTIAWKIPQTGSLVGYSPWGRKELDTTERLHFHFPLSSLQAGLGFPEPLLSPGGTEIQRVGFPWWSSG